MSKQKFNSIDIFSGVGGLTEGLSQAGFDTKLALEIDETASEVYRLNHPDTVVITENIRKVSSSELNKKIKGNKIHLLAGCPPCQGFSSIRRLNRKNHVYDERNNLILEFIRFVKIFKPYTIMIENVPGLIHYDLFKEAVDVLIKGLKYHIDYKIVNVKDYGVPQKRRRLVLVGSKLGGIEIAPPVNERKTVRDTIGQLPNPEESNDPVHKIFPKHSQKVQTRIELTPKDGGSRKDLPEEYMLECHKKKNVGFYDVYGRLRWDDYSTTITGGCLNPSKGRFLHPEQNRCISAREAALLQSFPVDYIFPNNIPLSTLALLIGNALPPKFSYFQAENIKNHLIQNLG